MDASAGSARRRPPTLKEIADLAGVHVSTVSRVLRQDPPPDGWSETALRIRSTAEELGYTPNRWAASLRTRRTQVIGAVMPRLEDFVIATMFQGVQQAAEEAGYSVLLSSPTDSPEEIRRAVELLAGRQVDGLMLTSVHRPGNAFIESLRIGTVPLLLANRHADTGLPCVAEDDHRGGVLAARHLLELGHRELGVVAGPAHASTANDRVLGFLEEAGRAGVLVAPDRVVHSDFEVVGGVDAARQLLTMEPRPTAIFAVNDTAAVGVLGTARDLGLRVPDDLSVVGFNDIPIVSQLPVPLTTIRSRAHEMGAEAVRQLLRLADGHPVESRQIPVELVVRDSTAPPGRP